MRESRTIGSKNILDDEKGNNPRGVVSSASREIDKKDIAVLFFKPEVEELEEYAQAVKEKGEICRALDKVEIYSILNRIHSDMVKMIKCFKEEAVSFDECYEELVSLYVFVELYFDLVPQN